MVSFLPQQIGLRMQNWILLLVNSSRHNWSLKAIRIVLNLQIHKLEWLFLIPIKHPRLSKLHVVKLKYKHTIEFWKCGELHWFSQNDTRCKNWISRLLNQPRWSQPLEIVSLKLNSSYRSRSISVGDNFSWLASSRLIQKPLDSIFATRVILGDITLCAIAHRVISSESV